MQTHTNRHSEAKRHSVTTIHYKYAQKKIIGSFLEMLPAITFSGRTTKSMPNLPNERSRENYKQVANLCNIKEKQEFELIIWGHTSYIRQYLYK